MTDTLRPVETAAAPPDTPAPPEPRTLKRSIGVVGGTLLTLSCVTPASTLFVVVPDLFGSLGTATALTIAIGSLLCVAVAFCYSELGTLVPSAGGEYAMVSTMAGRLAGWLVFVLSLLVVMIVPPVIAMGTADYLEPVLHLDPSLAGAGVMLLATLAGLLDLRANAWITGVFLVLEVIAAAVVAVLGFTHAERGPGSLVSMEVGGAGGGVDPVTAMLVVSGLAIALFITQGFSTAVYLSEELENPRRNVARTVLATLAISTVIILVPVVAITFGASDLTELTGGDIGAMVTAWSNSAVGTFVSLCVALAIVNAGIVMVIQNSRVLFASARDKAWPAPVNGLFAKARPVRLTVGRHPRRRRAGRRAVLRQPRHPVRRHRRLGDRDVPAGRGRRPAVPARRPPARARVAHAPVAGGAGPADRGPRLHPDPAGGGPPAADRLHRGRRHPVLGPVPAPAPRHPLAGHRPAGRPRARGTVTGRGTRDRRRA
ncbi:hypothetical protein STENM327S_02267 [Streptomyces tendae]